MNRHFDKRTQLPSNQSANYCGTPYADDSSTRLGPTLDDIREALDERGLLPSRAWSRRQFDAHCPCHNDRRPSLSIGETADGRDLTYCQAGCEREEILQALGLWQHRPHLLLLQGGAHRVPTALQESRDLQTTNVSKTLWSPLACWRRRAAAVRVHAEPGESFECVVPGHREHKHEATIHVARGIWRYWCADDIIAPHAKDPTAAGLSLTEVFKAQRTGGVHLLGDDALACRWGELLDYSAGVLEPTPVEVAAPETCGGTVARVAHHIALYVGLRDAGGGYGTGEPFTFAREFAMDYCGVSNTGARRAMGTLEKHGSIERTGDTVEVWGGHRAILWRLPK